MFTLEEIREKYLKFFESKGCKIVRSSSLVPNDPTLLFTSAGMVQFKNYYKGIEKPKFTRAVTAQKCVRAGGKHNDLEAVGNDARHHTFFEMLGNFSFGDYFKKEAITWAWEFLTKELLIPAEKLAVTIYIDDDEAYDIWKNIVGLPEDRIIRLKDNFWEMGDTGPCGPCSEIFYDHGPEIWGGLPGTPEEDGDRYIEIWNIVFTQFNRNEKGELEELEHKNIDTGMGLERIAAVLQGVHNNFEIDLFQKMIENSKNIIGDGNIYCHRIIADHLRSSCFLIADGVLPSNEGRGYVLRRIMRRAMLQINKLGCKKTTMFKLVPNFVNLMEKAYPELVEHEELIMETLKNEEDKFRETLDKGLKKLDEKIKNLQGNKLSGKDAFELYDTYGFPLDLTEMILKDKNITIDHDEFDEEMKKQKERARANWVGSGDIKNSEIYAKLTDRTVFEGYDKTATNCAKILNIIKDDKFVQEAKNGEEVEIVLDRTCFYGECGGQVGDIGLMILLSKDGSITLPFSMFEITNTLKTANQVIIHRGKVENGGFKVGDFVNLSINTERRKQITANHSSAHLLQYALKTVVGNTIAQKGSYVDENRLRFDVAFNRQITHEELEKVESIVNEIIIQNTETKTEVMPLDKAKEIGAIALFNEKYGDEVRVVMIGKNNTKPVYKEVENKDEYDINDLVESLTPQNHSKEYLSVELCGGTHVKRTGDIGLFKIIREEAIASGVRRIEAITGLKALEYMNNKINLINNISLTLKSEEENIVDKIKSLQQENKELSKELQEKQKNELKNLQFKAEQNGDITLYYNEFKNVNSGDFKAVISELLNEKYKDNSIIVAICKNDAKNVIIVGISKNISDKYDANNIMKLLNARGGGQKTLAMGSIQEYNLDSIKNILND